MDSLLTMLLQKMNLFVSDFIKQMNLKSINIVVFASIAGFVFTFLLMWNGGLMIERSDVELQVIGCIYNENTQLNMVSNVIKQSYIKI